METPPVTPLQTASRTCTAGKHEKELVAASYASERLPVAAVVRKAHLWNITHQTQAATESTN